MSSKRRAARHSRESFLALSAWIKVAPNPEVEREGLEGRPSTAIDNDLGRRMVGEGNAPITKRLKLNHSHIFSLLEETGMLRQAVVI
jgi:hypothetical protein